MAKAMAKAIAKAMAKALGSQESLDTQGPWQRSCAVPAWSLSWHGHARSQLGQNQTNIGRAVQEVAQKYQTNNKLSPKPTTRN